MIFVAILAENSQRTKQSIRFFLFLVYSASGTSAVAIDNKIEQAMVSTMTSIQKSNQNRTEFFAKL